jgi:hypothetical protein
VLSTMLLALSHRASDRTSRMSVGFCSQEEIISLPFAPLRFVCTMPPFSTSQQIQTLPAPSATRRVSSRIAACRIAGCELLPGTACKMHEAFS